MNKNAEQLDLEKIRKLERVNSSAWAYVKNTWFTGGVNGVYETISQTLSGFSLGAKIVIGVGAATATVAGALVLGPAMIAGAAITATFVAGVAAVNSTLMAEGQRKHNQKQITSISENISKSQQAIADLICDPNLMKVDNIQELLSKLSTLKGDNLEDKLKHFFEVKEPNTLRAKITKLTSKTEVDAETITKNLEHLTTKLKTLPPDDTATAKKADTLSPAQNLANTIAKAQAAAMPLIAGGGALGTVITLAAITGIGAVAATGVGAIILAVGVVAAVGVAVATKYIQDNKKKNTEKSFDTISEADSFAKALHKASENVAKKVNGIDNVNSLSDSLTKGADKSNKVTLDKSADKSAQNDSAPKPFKPGAAARASKNLLFGIAAAGAGLSIAALIVGTGGLGIIPVVGILAGGLAVGGIKHYGAAIVNKISSWFNSPPKGQPDPSHNKDAAPSTADQANQTPDKDVTVKSTYQKIHDSHPAAELHLAELTAKVKERGASAAIKDNLSDDNGKEKAPQTTTIVQDNGKGSKEVSKESVASSTPAKNEHQSPAEDEPSHNSHGM